MRSESSWVCAVLLVASIGAPAQNIQAPPVARDRLTLAVDESKTAVLPGTLHPLARAQEDEGPVDGPLLLRGMTLNFKRSASQQASLEALLAAQQDRSSPIYRAWLTPAQFAAAFGLTSGDIAKVSAWLQAQGFKIDQVAESRNSIRFTGTALQVERAFHTRIHRYTIQGEKHFANTTEIAVPEAFAGIISHVGGLHDFRPKPRYFRPEIWKASEGQPEFTSGISGNHYLAPGDFATIYDLDPLYAAGYTGSGQTIGIMGQTDIVVADIEDFRTAAGLPVNDPTVFLVPGSADPGTGDASGDIQEADLDLEWSGAIAQNASIVYVNSTNAVEGSLEYAIQNTIDGIVIPILSTSYGNCEQNYASSDIAALEADFQQANAQGQTIIGPSGDTGAADCDYTPSGASSPTVSATHGLRVDYPASSAYVTGLGGSEFTGDGTAAHPSTGADQYWSANGSADVLTSALSYIPEQAWNDTTFETGHGGALSAGGGGASKLFAKPAWQAGVPGNPGDSARDVPDLSLNASAAHDPYLDCTQIVLDSDTTHSHYVSSCNNGFRTSDAGFPDNNDLSSVGGTSASAPSFAGILALLEQKLGVPQGLGNINPTLYQFAANATTYASAFHDVTTGDNMVPCTAGSTDCPSSGQLGYSAGPGYDQASGLGSVDAANLASAFAAVASKAGTATTITASPSSPIVGAQVVLTATITANSGTNTPTGTVTFTIDGISGSPVTLADGAASLTTSFSTGGAHTIVASYSGDSKSYPSTGSTTLTVATSGSASATTTALTLSPGTIALYGALTLTATVQSPAAGSIQGMVTFSIGGKNIGTASIGTGSGGGATATLYVASATPALGFSPGTNTIAAAYGGDTNYAGSSATATLAVTNPGITLAVQNMTIASANAGSSGTSTISLSSSGGYIGTVNLTATAASLMANYSISPASVTLSSGGSATSTIVIQMAAAKLQQGPQGKGNGPLRPLIAASGFGLGTVFFLGLAGFSRKRWPAWAGTLLLLAGSSSFLGCGGKSSTVSSSPPGAYTVTVTATDATTSVITASSSFTVTIQ